MFEADLYLWNVDSLSSTNCFRFGHSYNIGVQQDGFPAPVLSGRAFLAPQKHSKVFFLQVPGAVYICNGVRRKVDRKGTSAGRISKLL